MTKQRTIAQVFAVLGLLAGGLTAEVAGQQSDGVIGVVGLTPAREHACVAAFVPLPEGKALAGVMWYNNDRTTSFPRVLLSIAGEEGPGRVAEATLAATSVAGLSSGFSELLFAEPQASASGGVYVIFEMPAYAEQVGLGDGGGPGIGYRAGSSGLAGWLSAEGVNWVRMRPDFRLAVNAIVVDGGTSQKAARTIKAPVTVPVVQQTMLSPASPNPFNPVTKIAFTLGKAGPVSLAIYTVRGELVTKLVDEHRAVGSHAVEWTGQDARGQASPSGLYFAQLKADGLVMTERLTLVR
jgi:hypothetical protein